MYSNNIAMEFIEVSREMYRPVRVCDTFFTGLWLQTFSDVVKTLNNKRMSNIILFPSQVLFDTTIYEQAQQVIWHMGS